MWTPGKNKINQIHAWKLSQFEMNRMDLVVDFGKPKFIRSGSKFSEEKSYPFCVNWFDIALASKDPIKENFHPESWIPWRYWISMLLAAGFTMCYVTRTALSIAIVAMTDNSTNSKFASFDWDLSTQSLVLSSFFWGYVPMNVIGAIAIQAYGPRSVWLISMIINSLSTLVIPIGSEYGGWPVACTLRLFQGLAQGPCHAALFSLITKWTTPTERAWLFSIAASGAMMGTTIGSAAGGFLADSGGGWPCVFYVFGSLSLGWCVLWALFGYDSPADHPYISEHERKLIELQYAEISMNKNLKIPWIKIISSMPVWAVIISSSIHCWGLYMLQTEMPTYIDSILEFNLKANGLLSAAPPLAMLFSTWLFGWLADVYNRLSFMPKHWNRKIFNSIGFLSQAITLVALISMDVKSHQSLAIGMFVIGTTGNAAAEFGYMLNSVDLSPNFAAMINGISNGVSSIFSALVPLAVGVIVKDKTDVYYWNIAFWTSAGAYFFGTIAYIICGSQKIQPWNDVHLTQNGKSTSKEADAPGLTS